jgi:hypothetical protein
MGNTVMATPEFDGGKDYKKLVRAYLDMIIKVIGSRMEQTGLEVMKNSRAKVPSVDYHSIAGDARTAASLSGGSINLSSAAGFNDDTGNLRSSIGFILSYNSEVVVSNFEESSNGTDKVTGIQEGIEYSKKLSKEHPNGFIVTIVAGMEYASFVEALGYDVLTGSTMGVGKKFEAQLAQDLRNIDFNNFKLK